MLELLLLAVTWLVLGCAVALLLGKAIDCGDGGVSKITPQRGPELHRGQAPVTTFNWTD